MKAEFSDDSLFEIPDCKNWNEEFKPFEMTRACQKCGFQGSGFIKTTNGQDVVYCRNGHWAGWNAPKSETGREVRSVSTHPDIKPQQRSRILERDNYRCGLCGKKGGNVHIGHIVSVKDGRILGLLHEEVYHDENLVTLCEECNLGQGSKTISLRQAVQILRARIVKQ